jgi:predicted amidohydrolase YtcJ
LEAEGLLAMRYRGSLLVDPDKGPEQVAGLVAERDRHKGPHFQTGSAKIFLDGGIEGATAFLLQPYAHRPGFSGEPLWDIENLRQVCVELDRAGFQIHVHVIGDAATRVTLDVFDHVRRTNGRRAARNLITHMQLVAPEDIARFAELGVVGVPQSFWFAIDDYYWKIYLPYLGKERADKMYPLQSFIDAKVVLASASDYPVTIPCNPVLGIQMGVTRSRPGKNSDPRLELREGDFGVLWPEERVGVSDMIATFTVNGAYANFLEHETGTLEMGKLADMVVLDRNLFDVAVTEIAEANVLMTLFEGRQVYRHPAL